MVDSEQKKDNIGNFDNKQDAVEVDEFWTSEKCSPWAGMCKYDIIWLIDGCKWIRPAWLLTPHVPEETLGMAHLGENQRAVTIFINYVNNETEQQWAALCKRNYILKA